MKMLVKSLVGENYQKLLKAITKQHTASVVDITELNDSFQIAPKSLIAWLMVNVASMSVGDSKIINAPWKKGSQIVVNKKAQDVYSGSIVSNGKTEHEFALCSIPQLAAHLLSYYELYDEAIIENSQKQEIKPELQEKISPDNQKDSDLSFQIQKLCDEIQDLKAKVNAVIVLGALQSQLQKSSGEFSEQSKQSQLTKLMTALKKLKKGHMPRPPKPGQNVGSHVHGITHAGFHGDKTPASDLHINSIQTHEKLNPYLKSGEKLARQFGLQQQPKPPKQAKLVLKSDGLVGNKYCPDCLEPIFKNNKMSLCSCFEILSKPDVKSKNGNIVLTFENDWSAEDRRLLLKTWAEKKDSKK